MNNSKSKHFTRGGQIAFHNIRMLFQVNKAVWKIYIILLFFVTFMVAYISTSVETMEAAVKYSYAELLNLIGNTKELFNITYQSKIYKVSVAQLVSNPYFSNSLTTITHNLLLSFIASFIASIFVCIGSIRYLTKKGRDQSESIFVRGARLENSDKVIKEIKANNDASNITVDSFPIIKNSEMQHFLVHGTVGTGKSQLIKKFLDSIRARGDRVIIYDKGCSFTPEFMDENKDVILNSFDDRCANWDLWLEAPRDSDFENMAESLIPLHGEHDPFWVMGARTVFACTAAKMRHDKDRSIDKLVRLLVTNKFEDLQNYLKGTAANTLVSDKIEKTAISIRTILTTYLKSLQTLRGLNIKEKKPYSIRDYILDESNKGWLFISSNGDQHASLKPLISMWLAMASITMLSLPESRERRIWFICDELPSLHKLPMLGETIAEVRKFGGCFMLGMQSFAQLGKVYGQKGASEIFDLLNTRFFFRSPSSEMARLVAQEIGEEEVEDARENYSYGANSIRDGISVSRNRVTRPIICYPEIMELPDLTCFARLPGKYPIAKLQIKYQNRTKTSAHFLSRDLPPIHDETFEKETSIRVEKKGGSSSKGEEVSMLPKEYEQYPEIEDAFM